MLDRTPNLLSINNYYYRRGGAEVLFLEQNRMLEEAGWQVVPFAMKHASNLPTPWDAYFPDEIEFGQDYSAGKLVRASRVIYSLQAREKLKELLSVFSPRIAHVHNIYHHLSPSIFSLLRDRGIPVVMTVHDLKLGCPAYTMMRGNKPCESCRGGKVHNVLLNKCIKGSAALSAVVMVEAALHRMLRTYESGVARFVVPSRFVLDTLVRWGWLREFFVHIPNFVDMEHFHPGNGSGRRSSSIADVWMRSRAWKRSCAPPRSPGSRSPSWAAGRKRRACVSSPPNWALTCRSQAISRKTR